MGAVNGEAIGAIVIRRLVVAFVFLTGFVLNPAFVTGCGGVNEPDFEFGEPEMLALLETTNDRVWEWDETGVTFSLKQGSELVLSQQSVSWLNVATACDDRSFVASAGACIVASRLAIEGTVTITDRTHGDVILEDAPVHGTMEVLGRTLSGVRIDLSHTQGSVTFDSEDGQVLELTELSW